MFILEFWHWWALALIFVVVEALYVSGAFVSLAIAGLVTGMAFNSDPDLGWRLQLVIFASTTIISFVIIKLLFGRKLAESAAETKVPSTLIGRELVLTQAIQNGFGEIEIDGINWALKGPDKKAGTVVKVVSVDGHYLAVYPFTQNTDENDQSDLH